MKIEEAKKTAAEETSTQKKLETTVEAEQMKTPPEEMELEATVETVAPVEGEVSLEMEVAVEKEHATRGSSGGRTDQGSR